MNDHTKPFYNYVLWIENFCYWRMHFIHSITVFMKINDENQLFCAKQYIILSIFLEIDLLFNFEFAFLNKLKQMA